MSSLHILDFERPVVELESKIHELRRLSDSEDFNIADEVTKLQGKIDKQLKSAYSNLTAWQKTQVARHPDRPHSHEPVKKHSAAALLQLLRGQGRRSSLLTLHRVRLDCPQELLDSNRRPGSRAIRWLQVGAGQPAGAATRPRTVVRLHVLI